MPKNTEAPRPSEQQWYFKSGSTLVELLIASYLYDEIELKKRLSEMQALITMAPTGTPNEMLEPMGTLVKYAAQTTYTDEDYVAIFEGAFGISELVNG